MFEYDNEGLSKRTIILRIIVLLVAQFLIIAWLQDVDIFYIIGDPKHSPRSTTGAILVIGLIFFQLVKEINRLRKGAVPDKQIKGIENPNHTIKADEK